MFFGGNGEEEPMLHYSKNRFACSDRIMVMLLVVRTMVKMMVIMVRVTMMIMIVMITRTMMVIMRIYSDISLLYCISL